MTAKPLVLVVDDNELLRVGCKLAFERAGFEVLLAINGAEGLEVARARIPDVVLLDLNMPVLNGWQTVRVLTRDPRTAGVPVIAYTAERIGVSALQLRAAGFRAYADKLQSIQAVVALVNLCLSDEKGGSDWVECGDAGPGPWRMMDAG